MVHCCWGVCTNNDKYGSSGQKQPGLEWTKWVPWPKDDNRIRKWIEACGTLTITEPDQVNFHTNVS